MSSMVKVKTFWAETVIAFEAALVLHVFVDPDENFDSFTVLSLSINKRCPF